MIKNKIVFGTYKEATDYINKYFETYHPAGYGTEAKMWLSLEGITVEVSRFSSCD